MTLPQLSRRAFLKRAALAGAAAALLPGPSQAGLFGKSRDPHTFAFFSDAHIAADPKLNHGGINMADNFAGCERELAGWRVRPAAIIVNGDLALGSGTAEDYVTFGRLLHPVRTLAPVHLSLGNHDDRENFWQAFPRDATRLESVPHKQASVFTSDRANWFLLDSLDVTASTPGELGPAQLDWLDLQLATRREQPAIVICHHPLDITGLLGLKDSLALEDLLVRHQQVKAFIFGHTHDWNVAQHPSGVHLINLPQTAYAFQPGRPSGWVRATLARDGMEVELRCLDRHHPEHGQVLQLKWRAA
ncbi:MAG: metallophosphoesterase [Verrucomicrobiota bacterium]